MLSFLLLTLISDAALIHTTVADSTRVAFIAQTPVSWETVEYDGLDYIRFEETPLTDSIGYPELPMITCLVAIPDSVTPRLEFAVSGQMAQSVDPVYPTPAQVMSYEHTPAVVDSFVQDSTAYLSDEFWPSERVRIIGETRICDQRLLQVQLFPAQYRASDSTISTARSFSVSVSFDSASAVWSSTGLGPFQRMVDGSSILGYHPVAQTHAPVPEYFGEVDPWTGPTRMPDYVIVCASGLYDQCDDAIDDLAEHRVDLNGFDVALVTTDEILDDFGGSDTVITDEILREFTEHMWENWDQPTVKKPEYLLLIGDHEDPEHYNEDWFLPTHEYDWDEESTPEGWDMVGNDEWYVYFNDDRDIDNDFPDMMVGRLSVKNSGESDTLSVLIQNLIDLEDPAGHPPTPDYRRRILRLAGTGNDLGEGYQIYESWNPDRLWTFGLTDWMEYDYSTTYCGDGRDFIDKDGSILSSHEWRDICLTEFGRGAGVAFYSDHGDFHMLSAGLEWLQLYIPQDQHTRGARDSTFNNYQIEENLSAVEDYAPPFVLLLCCGSGTFNHTIDHHEDRPTDLVFCHYDDATSQIAAYDFGTDCIAEKLMKFTDVPMAGVFCGSLSSVTKCYEYYGRGILEAVYIRGFGRLGDAIASARSEYTDYFTNSGGSYIREMGQFNLLGDPALDISDRVRYPNACDLVIHESDVAVSGYPYETSTGTELSMSFTVRNTGAQDSDEFDARIVFSHGQSSASAVVNCDELAAGAEAEYRYTWDCANWFDPPMEITVEVEADYLEECNDSWPGNNTGSCSIQLNDTYPTEDGWPVHTAGVVGTTPLLVDLDEDADLEIVALTGTSLTAYEHDGSVIWTLLDQGFTSENHPMAADLDQDGTSELLLHSSDGIKVISPSGSVIYRLSGSVCTFVIGNMHPRPGLELCIGDGDTLKLYYWDATLKRFIHIRDEVLQGTHSWTGVSLACADLTGNSYEDVAYCYSRLSGGIQVYRDLAVYDWASDSVAYSEEWLVASYNSILAAGELGGTKEVGYSFGSYESGSSDPAMLIEFNGSVQEHDCEQGTEDAGNLMCGVFADWDAGVSGADAFVLPSEVQCLAWNYEGAELSGWPTEGYIGAEYGSSISPTALGDLDDEDDADVLFCTELYRDYSLLAYGSDGELLSYLDFPIVLPEGVSALGGFSIADIDRDDYIEIVFGTGDGLLHCWELGESTTGYAPWVQFQHDHGRTGVLE